MRYHEYIIVYIYIQIDDLSQNWSNDTKHQVGLFLPSMHEKHIAPQSNWIISLQFSGENDKHL